MQCKPRGVGPSHCASFVMTCAGPCPVSLGLGREPPCLRSCWCPRWLRQGLSRGSGTWVARVKQCAAHPSSPLRGAKHEGLSRLLRRLASAKLPPGRTTPPSAYMSSLPTHLQSSPTTCYIPYHCNPPAPRQQYTLSERPVPPPLPLLDNRPARRGLPPPTPLGSDRTPGFSGSRNTEDKQSVQGHRNRRWRERKG